jgi:UDP-3-O-[3-hydroxymyristoyl] glucosamine N-acyltransferase
MGIRIADIVDRIGATLINASEDIIIEGAATLERAGAKDISFVSNPRYIGKAIGTNAAAVILAQDVAEIKTAKLITPNPYLAWARTLELFIPDRSAHLPRTIHATAIVHPSAVIGSGVHIGPNVCIGANTSIGTACIIHAGVVIEEDCLLLDNVEVHPNSVIHYGTSIGNNCFIWSSVVIGGYGFGNAKDGPRFVGIPQLGKVILEDDVSVGSSTTIDRGAIDDTIIRRGAKIDNMVMIAHNVEIGEDTAIASQTGISGSTKVGARVLIAGQAGFVGHVSIGDDSFVGAKAGISKSFPPGSKITGYPARNLMDIRRSDAAVARLPDLVKRVCVLEELIKKLEDSK